MIGFMFMVGIRGYIMLLAEGATNTLTVAALSGVGSALCLMVSVVNRGVESGGGDGVGYGKSILALLSHYVVLLYARATNVESFGPLELSAIVLQVMSLCFTAYAILGPAVQDSRANTVELKIQAQTEEEQEGDASTFGVAAKRKP
jgi:hypothetical protein